MKIQVHPFPRSAIAKPVSRLLALASLIAFSSLLSVQAGQERETTTAQKPAAKEKSAATAKKAPAPAVAAKSEMKAEAATKVTLTGSRIPRSVRQRGAITDTASPVIVITRQELDRSGAMTLADALRRLPIR